MLIIQRRLGKRIWSKFYMDYLGEKKTQQHKHLNLFSGINCFPEFLSKQYFISRFLLVLYIWS